MNFSISMQTTTKDRRKNAWRLPRKAKLVETSSHASSVKIRREPSPFDEKSTFITSTPKSESNRQQQGKRKDQEVYRASPAVSYGITRFKGISVVEFQLKVQMVNNIKNVKMCTKALLASVGRDKQEASYPAEGTG
ncbi:hypothetical protein OS493_027092 [Desmophyllum pertusum]|uniref:Uncharacterized protein n=1 Tax=Desmophyllum pertusum TaxID=174260 RepID=A0A9X0CEZ9_9CNID|nr:hypothetical protein OS493_027092 [Desmophyllum pertusum]